MTPTGATAPNPGRLLQVLGTAFGLAIVVGATIGGGILGAPSGVAAALPTTALFMGAWIFGGINAMLGATAYSELGTMMPRSGGLYVYAHRAFGDGVGFAVGYADWINWSVSSAALILLVGDYLGAVIPAAAGHALAAGSAVFAVLVVLQWAGVRSGGRAQEVTSVLKAFALLGLVVAAFVMPHGPLPATTAPPPIVPHGIALLLAFGVAMQGVIFSYDSYYAVVYCGEEIVDPGRAIPRAIFRGLLIIIAIYLLINAAYLRVVPVERIAGDPLIGGTVATLLFGSRGDMVIRLIAIIAILGTVNAQIMAAPRILVAMARDGLFPARATRVNAGGTPTVALAASLALVGVFLLLGSFDAVLAVDAFLIGLMYVTVFASLFRLRRTEPGTARPYRAWGYPYVQVVALVITFGLLAAMTLGDHRSALITAGVLLASWPVWMVVRRLVSR